MDHSLGLSGKQQGWQRWVQTLAAPSGKLRRWHEHSSTEPWTPTPCLVRGFLWASSLLKKLHWDEEDLAAFVIATWALWKCSWALNKDVIHAMLSLFYSPLLWEKVCHLESSDDVRPPTLVTRDDSRRMRAETFFLVNWQLITSCGKKWRRLPTDRVKTSEVWWPKWSLSTEKEVGGGRAWPQR